MVGPLLKITLVPNSELVRASIPVLFDLMDQEYRAKGSFKQVREERNRYGSVTRTVV